MNTRGKQDTPTIYEIRVKGVLDATWSDWFDAMTIAPQADGTTLLTGPVRDQAALHGLLARVRDLGLCLLSVNRADESPVEQEG